MMERWKNLNNGLPVIDINDIFQEQPQLNGGKILRIKR